MDATGEDPQAPDIHRVRVSNSARDDITFLIEITNRATLDKNLRVDVYLDTDQVDTTGRPSDGADFTLTVIGDLYPAANFVTLSQWSAGAWHEVPSTIGAIYHTQDPFGAEIQVPRAGPREHGRFRVRSGCPGHVDHRVRPRPGCRRMGLPVHVPGDDLEQHDGDQHDQHGWVDEHDHDISHVNEHDHDISTSTSTTTTSPTSTSTTTTPTTTPTETTTTTPPPPPTSTATTTVVAPPVTTTVQQTTTVGGQTTTVRQTTTVATTRARSVHDHTGPCRSLPEHPRRADEGAERDGQAERQVRLPALPHCKRARDAPLAAGSRAAVRGRRDDPEREDEESGFRAQSSRVQPSIGGKAVAVRRKFFDVRHSAAYCYWMIPASAHGAVLRSPWWRRTRALTFAAG